MTRCLSGFGISWLQNSIRNCKVIMELADGKIPTTGRRKRKRNVAKVEVEDKNGVAAITLNQTTSKTENSTGEKQMKLEGDRVPNSCKQSLTPDGPVCEDGTSSDERLTADWFDCPCVDLAKNLLGMKLVRKMESGERVSGIIVETEAYLGGEDKASHSHAGKRTERNKAMYMAPGTAYVYNIYGIYTCINVSSQGDGAAVLLRSLEASEGEDLMRKARSVKKSEKSKELKHHMLCNGPSKLTQAFGITKANGDQVDLTVSPILWMEKGIPVQDNNIVSSKRIGIAYAEEWTDKPLRFYIRGSPSVSIRDKEAENDALK